MKFNALWLGITLTMLLGPIVAEAVEKDRLEAAKQEIERRERLWEWFKEKKAPRAELMKRTYGPLLEANREQFSVNQARAQKYREWAEKALQRNMEERAQEYARAAKLFYEYANANRKIGEALQSKDSEALQEGFAEVRELEKQLLQLTGKQAERKWFTPAELAHYGKIIAQMKAEQKEDGREKAVRDKANQE